jgi:protein SCO1/2
MKSLWIRFGVLLLIAVVGILIAMPILTPEQRLPIYQPSDINPKLVDESVRGVASDHRIADFELVNQMGQAYRLDDLAGKIYVADFFFTTCPTICKDMVKHMYLVQEAFEDDAEIHLVSHTVYPEQDSVSVMFEYGQTFGVNPEQWTLLTGEKKVIYDLARKSYFAVTTEGNGGETDFIHTENFVLVDKDKRLRGFYDGTDLNDVQRLIKDIHVLKKEYEEES